MIKDGTGKGYLAKVNADNQLDVFAVTEPEDKFLNRSGNVWTISFDVTPTGANDIFFYLKNTGSDDLLIDHIDLSSTVSTRINILKVSGTPTYSGGEVEATPVNRNLGSSKALSCICKYDVDITALTNEGQLLFEQCKETDTRYSDEITSGILIP